MVCKAWDELIGNYSQYFPDYNMCGISDKFQTDSNCFEYHRDISPQLIDARDVWPGEAPWVVVVEARTDNDRGSTGICSGSFISKRWVLTSAHCLIIFQSSKYMGVTHIGSEYFIKHPNYTGLASIANDIGLIKTGSESKPDQSDPNSTFLCLPAKDFSFNGKRIAMVAGWSNNENDKDLQIGPILIQKSWANDGPYLHVLAEFSGPKSCPGDSGAPYWVYHMGRAVIVGVSKGVETFKGDNSNCSKNLMGASVPFHLNWILETIRKYDKLP